MTRAEDSRLARVEEKIDTLTDCLLDPDTGLYSRVARNTTWRKVGQWILGILLAGNLGALIWIKLFP